MFSSLFHKIQVLSETVVYEKDKELKSFFFCSFKYARYLAVNFGCFVVEGKDDKQ